MQDKNNQNLDLNQYYKTLPAFIKESIEQSGLEFRTTEELQAFVNQLQNK